MTRYHGVTDGEGRPLYHAEDLENGTTGTGAVVLQVDPTITRPAIGNFVNANHTHENANAGGQLDLQAASKTDLPTTDLAGDWNADTISASDASAVTAWADDSGNSRTLSTYAGTPVYYLDRMQGACVEFGGAAALTLAANLTLSGDFHIFLTGYTTQDSMLWSPTGGANDQIRAYDSSTNTLSMYDGTTQIFSSVTPYAMNTPMLFEWARSGSTGIFRINGLHAGTGAFGATRDIVLRAFAVFDLGGSNYWLGRMKRTCVYSALQSGDTLKRIRYRLMVQAGIR